MTLILDDDSTAYVASSSHSQDPKPSKTLYLLSNEIKNPFTENCNIQDPNLLCGLIFNTPL